MTLAELIQDTDINGLNVMDATLFGLIADDIEKQGYSIQVAALPDEISTLLFACQQSLNSKSYTDAGIGRTEGFARDGLVRTDRICWITDETVAGGKWLDWVSGFQGFLNRRLYLGLFSFESHFAHYSPGDYYKRHYDAFRGAANRVLSIVIYLNPEWGDADCGELVLYRDDLDGEGIRILPRSGTMVVFLSETFPHEVLPAARDRYSVAGWFRVNTSMDNKIDALL